MQNSRQSGNSAIKNRFATSSGASTPIICRPPATSPGSAPARSPGAGESENQAPAHIPNAHVVELQAGEDFFE